MKTYIVLGYIFGIGGWQTYIANKIELMKENGWNAVAISNQGRETTESGMLEKLRRFKNNRVATFICPYVSRVSTKDKENVISFIKKCADFKDGDCVIVEATTLDLFIWAEYIAQQLKGRSVCIEVSNRFKKYPRPILDFFEFKSKRNELMMLLESGKAKLFEGYIDYDVEKSTLGPLTLKEYKNYDVDYRKELKTDDYDYVIGTVGWLNKPYYTELIDEIISFSKANQKCKILFVIIGKSTSGAIERSYEFKSKGVSNLRLSFLGAISPLPENLIRLFDVAIASYGCALITSALGVKTILMDDSSVIPLGILGYTKTKQPLELNENPDSNPVSVFLQEILIKRLYDNYKFIPYPIKGTEDQKANHINHILSLPPDIKYYDVDHLYNGFESRKHKFVYLFQQVFGSTVLDLLYKLK